MNKKVTRVTHPMCGSDIPNEQCPWNLPSRFQKVEVNVNPIDDQRGEALRHYKEASNAVNHWSGFVQAAIEAYNPASLERIKLLEKALTEILKEPYGCPMCDSGKLRRTTKEHWDDCPFYIAKKLLEGENKVHPEDFCKICGSPNPFWTAENTLFNQINGSPNGIMCPNCFITMANKKNVGIIIVNLLDDKTES